MTDLEFSEFVWSNARTYLGFEGLSMAEIQAYFDDNIRITKQSIFDMEVALEEVKNCSGEMMQKHIDDNYLFKQAEAELEKKKFEENSELSNMIRSWDPNGLTAFKTYLVSMYALQDSQSAFWFKKPTLEEQRSKSIDFCLNSIKWYQDTLVTLNKQEKETMEFLYKLNTIMPEPVSDKI